MSLDSSSRMRRSARGRRNGSAARLTTFSGVAANFGGIPLAFAFIAIARAARRPDALSQESAHFDITAHGFSLFNPLTGVALAYMYFQLPLMILVIAPAIDGLKREWREASSNLGASQLAVLAVRRHPSADAVDSRRIILLFGNAFAAYATAYGINSGSESRSRSLIGAVLQRQRVQQPPSRASDGVRDVRRARHDDDRYIPLQRRAARWAK